MHCGQKIILLILATAFMGAFWAGLLNSLVTDSRQLEVSGKESTGYTVHLSKSEYEAMIHEKNQLKGGLYLPPLLWLNRYFINF